MDEQKHASHSPVPWTVRRDALYALSQDRLITAAHKYTVANVWHQVEIVGGAGAMEANARRICAAVNAVEGIATEALENGAVKALVEALEELLEVAKLRGDDQLPDPADDPKPWTVRMASAWDEAHAALEAAKGEPQC